MTWPVTLTGGCAVANDGASGSAPTRRQRIRAVDNNENLVREGAARQRGSVLLDCNRPAWGCVPDGHGSQSHSLWENTVSVSHAQHTRDGPDASQ
jgi:hypothetical protein